MPELNSITDNLSLYSDYISERNSHLKKLENPRLQDGRDEFSGIHADKDSNPSPTIGYGYNLTGKSLAQNTAFFTFAFGGSLSPTQSSALGYLDDWQEGRAVTINGTPRVLTNQDILDGAEGLIPELAVLDSLKLNEAQASILLSDFLEGIPGFDGAEKGLNTALAGIDFVPSNPDESKLPESKERLALLSMYYQLPELIGPDLKAALQADNRAEAWFQIRYKHLNYNDSGLQNRKNTESDLFGLTRTEDLDEYAEALAYLYTNHRQTIDQRDANSPFLAAIATQKQALENAYTNGRPVDFIYMGTDSSTHQDKLGGDDLIFGDFTAASTLHGYGGHDVIIGGAGNDQLFGDAGEDRLYGREGDDTLYGGADVDYLNGGGDNDTLYGEGGADNLYGEGGADELYGGADNDVLAGGIDSLEDTYFGDSGIDTYHVQALDEVTDEDVGNRFYFHGQEIKFSEGFQESESSSKYLTSDAYDYIRTESGFAVEFLPIYPSDSTEPTGDGGTDAPTGTPTGHTGAGGTIQINGNTLEEFGLPIRPYDPNTPLPPRPNGPGSPGEVPSPVALDLDGNGSISTTGFAESNTYFDLDNNGRAERTGWVSANDGLLVRDINFDGLINGGLELFGTSTRAEDGLLTGNGFTALSWLDSNQDNKISSIDLAWNELSVWKDANQNGISEHGELFSLSSAGVASISVNFTEQLGTTDSHGNQIPYVGSYTTTTGSQRLAADIFFRTDPFFSKPTRYLPVTAEIANLPNMSGVGKLSSLHQSMSINPALKDLVTSFVLESDPATRRQIAESILLEWAGVQSDDTVIAFSYSAEKLAVVSKVYGTPYVGNFNASATPMLEMIHSYWVDRIYSDLNRQTHLAYVFSLINEIEIPETNSVSKDLSSVITHIDNLISTDSVAGLELLEQFTSALTGSGIQNFHNYDEFREHYLSGDLETSLRFASANSMQLTGTPNADSYRFASGHYYIVTGDGDDVLEKDGRGNLTVVSGDGDNRLNMAHGFPFMADQVFQTVLRFGDGDNRLTLDDSKIWLDAGNGDNTATFKGGNSRTSLGNGNNSVNYYPSLAIETKSAGNSHYLQTGDGNNLVTAIYGGEFEFNTQSGKDTFNISGSDAATIDSGGGNDIVYLLDSTSQLTLGDGDDNAQLHGSIATVYLGGGSDVVSIVASTATVYGGAGNDVAHLYGPGVTTVYLGVGDDTVNLHGGKHTFPLHGGDGSDLVTVYVAEANDRYTFIFGEQITPLDIRMSRQSGYLNVEYNETGDAVRLLSSVSEAALLGAVYFEFASGTTKSLGTLLNETVVVTLGTASADSFDESASSKAVYIRSLEGNDSLNASNYADTLDGGAGNDVLQGGAGNDTYLFGVDSGTDLVIDTAGNDRILMGPGILPENVVIGRMDAQLILSVASTSDQLTVDSWFTSTSSRVESVEFENGTVWTATELQAAAFVGTPGNDNVSGNTSSNVLLGLAGNDTLLADSGADTLDGGSGNDNLDGGLGNDKYIFKSAYGRDVIYESGGTDTIELGTGIATSDIIVGRNNTDLLLVLDGTEDKLIVSSWFDSDSYRIEAVVFADGTQWQKSTLHSTLNFFGSDSADALFGTSSGDTFHNSKGDDSFSGDAGADTYRFGRSSGRDLVQDLAGSSTEIDRIVLDTDLTPEDVAVVRDSSSFYLHVLGSQDRVKFTSASSNGIGIEQVVFNNGTIWGYTEFLAAPMITILGTASADTLTGTIGDDTISGGNGNDTLTGSAGFDMIYGEIGNDVLAGGAGNDTIVGGAGNDTFRFGIGDGNDTVTDDSGTDKIEIGMGLLPADVTLGRIDNTLFVRINATNETLSVTGWFDSTAQRVESVTFADGTIWNTTTLNAAPFVGSNVANYLMATSAANSLFGLEGNDTLIGLGGNDTLDGGAGNDALDGGDGNDTYKFGYGAGNDTIQEYSASTGDKVILGTGINQSHVELSRDESSLYLKLISSGELLTMQYWFAETNYRIERIDFSDGSYWTTTNLAAAKHYLNGTAAADSLQGISGPDVFDGGGGSDSLSGAAGNDIYVFGLGSGNDLIADIDSTSGNLDTVQLKDGLTASDVMLYRDESSAYLMLTSSGEVLTMSSWYSSTDYRVEKIQFSNGTSWTSTQFLAAPYYYSEDANTISLTTSAEVVYANGGDDIVYAGAGNDTIYGGAGSDYLVAEGGSDILRGGAGNDYLHGGDANDKYLFGRGDGVDHIVESAIGGTDRVVFDAGIANSDLIVGRSDNHLVVRIRGGNDAIVVDDRFAQSNVLLETLELSDGTLLSVSSFPASSTYVGMMSNDDIYGTTGNDKFYGGAGNDSLHGDAGSDTYYFELEDDADTIWEVSSATGTDKVVFGIGITAAMLSVEAKGSDLEVSVVGTDDKLIVNSWYASTVRPIERFELHDGTEWVPGVLEVTPRIGSELGDAFYGDSGPEHFIGLGGNDTLIGNSGDDVLDGGIGTDYLQGDDGADTAVFGQGYGLDTFVDVLGQNKVQLVAGIAPADVSVFIDESYIYFVLTVTNDALRTLITRNGTSVENVPQVAFAGGTTWSPSDVLLMAQVGTTPFSISLQGTTADDVLVGNDRADGLHGLEGNDVLDGRGGADFMNGGPGNDTYYVNHALDNIYDTSGVDIVFSVVTFSMPVAIENLTLTHYADADGTGNSQDNTILGNSGINTLLGMGGNDLIEGHLGDDSIYGGDGNDQLYGGVGHDLLFGGSGDDILDGGEGNDVLRGGAGDDRYSMNASGGHDIVAENDSASGNEDAIVLGEGILPEDIQLHRNQEDLVISIVGENSSLTIKSFYSHERHEIEEVRFNGNTVWDLPAVAPTGGGSLQSVLAMEEDAGTRADDIGIDVIALVGSRFETVEAFA